MPADALPVSWDDRPPATPDTPTWTRTYQDVAGPMTGTVTITRRGQSDEEPTIVNIIRGAVAVDLPPGTYRVVAQLRTATGSRLVEEETITLTA